MSVDFGRLNIDSSGNAETFASDLATDSAIRPESRVTAIAFHAPKANSGNVYVGRLGRDKSTSMVSSTYGWTLEPGDSFPLNDINEIFSNFEGDAATSGDDIEWVASFEASSQKKVAS